jgi:hypothetical protein
MCWRNVEICHNENHAAHIHEGFDVLMAVTVRSAVFWVVTPDSSWEEHIASIFRAEN